MSKYKYNTAVGEKAAEKRLHTEGVFARLVIGVDRYVAEDRDDLTVIVRSQALSNPEDPSSLVPGTDLGEFFTLPIDNPDVPDHDFLAGEWADMQAKSWAEFAAAIWPEEVPLRPMKQSKDAKGKLTGPYFFQGEEIDSEDYPIYLQQAVDAAGAKAIELLDALDTEEDLGPEGLGLVGTGYFAAIRHKTKDDVTRVNQVAYRAELPSHWTEDLETERFVVVQNAAPSAPSAKKAKKSKAKKTSAKRNTRRKAS